MQPPPVELPTADHFFTEMASSGGARTWSAAASRKPVGSYGALANKNCEHPSCLPVPDGLPAEPGIVIEDGQQNHLRTFPRVGWFEPFGQLVVIVTGSPSAHGDGGNTEAHREIGVCAVEYANWLEADCCGCGETGLHKRTGIRRSSGWTVAN